MMEYDFWQMSTSSISAHGRSFHKILSHILQQNFAYLVNGAPNFIFPSASFLWFVHVSPLFHGPRENNPAAKNHMSGVAN